MSNLGDSFNPKPKPEKREKKAKKPLKRAKVKKTAAKDAKCDHWFSIYIRLRDANDEGYCRCIVSGEWVHWMDCDAGHFISRGEKATKYHEQNVHAQKRQSNRFKSGEQLLYGKNLDVKYGKGTADKILVLSKQTRRFEQFELDAMGKFFQQRSELYAAAKGQEIPEYMYKQRYY